MSLNMPSLKTKEKKTKCGGCISTRRVQKTRAICIDWNEKTEASVPSLIGNVSNFLTFHQ